jgi:FKBP-type peptidyl-prolyl cis-trans isomerase
MSTTPSHQRVFALIAALLILATAVASGALVIWQINQDNKNAALTKSLQANQSSSKEGKLEGTKLADFTPVAKVDKLQVIDLKEGTGEPIAAGGTITAHYTGAVASTGVIFQSSKDSGQPFTSPLSNLIKGWQEGIPGMKPGGIRRILIPAAQAYGDQSQPGIPANSDLVFDIELVTPKYIILVINTTYRVLHKHNHAIYNRKNEQ